MLFQIQGKATVTVTWECDTEAQARELWEHFMAGPFGEYMIAIDRDTAPVIQPCDEE